MLSVLPGKISETGGGLPPPRLVRLCPRRIVISDQLSGTLCEREHMLQGIYSMDQLKNAPKDQTATQFKQFKNSYPMGKDFQL